MVHKQLDVNEIQRKWEKGLIGPDEFLDIFRVVKEAEANRLKLTPEFLELKFIEAIANNTKIFFGDKVRR